MTPIEEDHENRIAKLEELVKVVPKPGWWETTALPWLTSKTAVGIATGMLAVLATWFGKPVEPPRVIEKEVPAKVAPMQEAK